MEKELKDLKVLLFSYIFLFFKLHSNISLNIFLIRFTQTIAITTLPYPPSDVQSFISRDQHRLTWDRNVKELTSITVSENIEEKKKVIILRSSTNRVGPITSRDFIDITLITAIGSDGSLASAGKGIENSPKFPICDNYVRGFNNAGCGWLFEILPQEDRSVHTKISYVIETDLKGWFLPVVVNNAIGGSYVTFFEDLKKAMQEEKEKEKEKVVGEGEGGEGAGGGGV